MVGETGGRGASSSSLSPSSSSCRLKRVAASPWSRATTGGRAAATETEEKEEEVVVVEEEEDDKTDVEVDDDDDDKEEAEEVPPRSRPPRGQYCGEEDGVASGADAARALRTLELPALTNEDAYFTEKVGTEFVYGQRPEMDVEELNALFAAVGFPRRDPVRLRRALVNSHAIVWVLSRHDVTGGLRSCRRGQCIGFARATSDKIFNATIWAGPIVYSHHHHNHPTQLVRFKPFATSKKLVFYLSQASSRANTRVCE